MDADVATYLPWDLTGPLSQVLEAVRPDAVLFTKTEVWPTLVAEADRRDIPTGIVAATVPEGAGRMRPLARSDPRACVERALDRLRELGGRRGCAAVSRGPIRGPRGDGGPRYRLGSDTLRCAGPWGLVAGPVPGGPTADGRGWLDLGAG